MKGCQRLRCDVPHHGRVTGRYTFLAALFGPTDKLVIPRHIPVQSEREQRGRERARTRENDKVASRQLKCFIQPEKLLPFSSECRKQVVLETEALSAGQTEFPPELSLPPVAPAIS
jgi:hypothetical protein